MTHFGSLLLVAFQCAATLHAADTEGGVSLIRDGKPVGVIVIPSEADSDLRSAVEAFVETARRSTGATLPVIHEDAEAALPGEQPRLFVGATPQAVRAGIIPEEMKPESYRLLTKKNSAFIVGKTEEPNERLNSMLLSRPVLWGLNHVLESQLGVRWLWPGELGTYVPRKEDLVIPASDISYQPKLMIRRMRAGIKGIDEKLAGEVLSWLRNHQNGRRDGYYFREPFVEWWDRYSKKHPDLFAELPPERTQPYPNSRRVKLRLANPKVIDFIASEYRQAGAPEYWSICPNDGSGFDISDATRQWDVPRDQNIDAIVYARGADLTARYVTFWNRIYDRLKAINPEIKLTTIAYSSYRNPPPAEVPLTAKTVISIVDSLDAYETWKGWSQYSYGMHLRPNWWHQGADAPYIPYEKTAKYIRFAHENGMIGFDMDSLIGYWGTQGFNYYMVARLISHPELTLEAILNEYTAAFGAGAPFIRRYLAHWNELSNQYNYPINAGGAIRDVPSRYDDLVREEKISLSILQGSKQALPYLYTDKVLEPGFKLLDEAARAIGPTDPEALARVGFLRKGLQAMQATREQIALGQKLKENPSREAFELFRKKAVVLEQLREKLTPEHVVWGWALLRNENQYKIRIRPENFTEGEINLDGL